MDFLGVSRAYRNSVVSWPHRAFLQRKLATRETDYVARVARLTGFSPYSDGGHRLDRILSQSEEVFVLGSGASVLDVPAGVWKRIEAQVSIGFGPWALHSFVPDIFAYGPTRGLPDYARVISDVMARPEIIQKKPTVLFLRSDLPEDLETLFSLPEAHWPRTYIYGRISPISKSRREIAREVRRWHVDARNRFRGIAFDSGATLVRLLSLSLLAGAKKIILVGVDLNSVEYFWEREHSYLTSNGFADFDTRQPGVVHDTLLATNRVLGVLAVIEDMARMAIDELGCAIEVVSPHSALASVLPIYAPPPR